jgi:hypothetical protein
MTITNSNLFSESYNILKTFLNANITDPKGRYKKQWIHDSMPNVQEVGFDGYPFITLQVDVTESKRAFDNTTSDKTFRALISVYSDQATDVDTISDQVVSKLKAEQATELQVVELSSSPFDFQIVGGRKIKRRILGLRGKLRI